jgi:hypothetical protein
MSEKCPETEKFIIEFEEQIKPFFDRYLRHIANCPQCRAKFEKFMPMFQHSIQGVDAGEILSMSEGG